MIKALSMGLLLLALSSPQVDATESPTTEKPAPISLQPFSLNYRAKYGGVPFKGKATRILTYNSQEQIYSLTTRAKGLFMKLTESVQFKWDSNNCASQPIIYQYERSGLGKNRSFRIEFDTANQQATYIQETKNSQSDPKTYPIGPKTADRLTEQLILRCQVMQGLEEMSIEIARKDKVVIHRFQRIGEEQLSTPKGTFNAIKVARDHEGGERETFLWFAPELNHRIIQIDQEDDGKRYSVRLTD